MPFPSPLNCPTGFLIGVATKDFLGIGITASDENHPFHEGRGYWMDGPYDQWWTNIRDIAEVGPCHLMVRAIGEDKGSLQPQGMLKAPASAKLPGVSYTVYRLRADEVNTPDLWEIIADEEKELSTIDDEKLEKGEYRWAITVNYPDGKVSEPVLTSVLQIGESGVGNVISENTEIREIEVYGADGIRVGIADGLHADSLLSSLKKGVYVVLVRKSDGTAEASKLVIGK